MATVKIQCPQCLGTGLTGAVNLSVCSECNGTGTISVSDASTIAAVNTASMTPIEVTAAVGYDQAQINIADNPNP
jgi:DnaJ-class molecular chaperone